MSKMSFKIYRQDLKVTGEGLVMFKLETLKFESGRGDRDDSSIMFYCTTVSILFCLKTLTLRFKVVNYVF